MFAKALFAGGLFLFGALIPMNLRVIRTGEYTYYETVGTGIALLMISFRWV